MRNTKGRFLAMLLAVVLALGSCAALGEGAVSQEEWDAAVAAESADSWMNILLLGCDSYTKNNRQRTDSMIIVSINAETRELKMTSLKMCIRDRW